MITPKPTVKYDMSVAAAVVIELVGAHSIQLKIGYRPVDRIYHRGGVSIVYRSL